MTPGFKKSLRDHWFRVRSRKLHQDAALDIRAVTGRGSGAMVVFTSYNANATKRGLMEFARSASDGGTRHCLFVTDRRQGWFEGGDVTRTIVQVVRRFLARFAVTRVMTLGVSMGGFAALSFANELGAGRALALSPQYTANPERFPDDPRWSEARGRISAFTRPALEQSMAAPGQFTVLHSRRHKWDLAHWRAFPLAGNVHHYLMDHAQHDVIDPLRSAGALYPLVDAVWSDAHTRVRNLMASVHAVPRARDTIASASVAP